MGRKTAILKTPAKWDLLTLFNVLGFTPGGADRRQSADRRHPGIAPTPRKGRLNPAPPSLSLSPLRGAQGQDRPRPSPLRWCVRRSRPRLDRRRARRTGRPRLWWGQRWRSYGTAGSTTSQSTSGPPCLSAAELAPPRMHRDRAFSPKVLNL